MTSEIQCPHCGQMHKATARFCPATGKPLSSTSAPQTASPYVAAITPQVGGGLTGRLLPNAMLYNRYVIVRKIGQGGMAAVYQAVDTRQPGAMWAIKEMSDAAISNPQERSTAIQSFLQEANLLRSLNHPNLPKVQDVFTEGGKYYLVMEFVAGQTLEVIANSRPQPISEPEVTAWAMQLCNVLSYLHNQPSPIIFRDLKPGNIMLTPQGQIKLIDFGIVRFFKPGKTKDTQALGTPGYCAPEALNGQTDVRSDVYSLCVTMHQLLTGYDPVRTMFNIPPARQINPMVSSEMDRILQQGSQADRNRRWASMDALKAELARLGSSTSTLAQQPPSDHHTGNNSSSINRTSRPTTRLLLAAVQLSPRQLAGILTGTLFGLIILTWALTPVLAAVPFDWNLAPIMAVFGAFGYATYPRRGIAFVSHVLLTTAMVATIWMRMGSMYSPANLILAALSSGTVMEGWVFFLPGIKKRGGGETWKREMAWLAGMAVIGIILFYGIVTNWSAGLNPISWFFAALFGCIGWFLGDLINQYWVYRQTGLRRPAP